MVSPYVEQQLRVELAKLPAALQERVLEFARSLLVPGLKGTPGAEVARLSGSIDADDAGAMTRIIETDCERVDDDGW